MKIALCKSHFFGPVSGADEILVSYAISLHHAGHEVDVVLLYKPTENDRFNGACDRPACLSSQLSTARSRSRSCAACAVCYRAFCLLFLLVPRTEAACAKSGKY